MHVVILCELAVLVENAVLPSHLPTTKEEGSRGMFVKGSCTRFKLHEHLWTLCVGLLEYLPDQAPAHGRGSIDCGLCGQQHPIGLHILSCLEDGSM